VLVRKFSGVHRGKGVDPVHSEIEKEIREKYKNGTKCGNKVDKSIMQVFIPNPLLI